MELRGRNAFGKSLMGQYGVSRATIRQALNELATLGLIIRKRGKGTFVAIRKVDHELLGDLSFSKQLANQGLAVTSKVLLAKVEYPSKGIGEVLGISLDTKTFQIIRIRLADKEPIIFRECFHS